MADLHAAIRERFGEIRFEILGADPDSHGASGVAQLVNAVAAVLDLHEPKYYNDEIQHEERDEPAYDKNGKLIGYIRIKGAALPPDWCESCGDVSPCSVVRLVAEKLGAEA